MEIDFDCIPCIFRQALESSRMATEDEELIKEILDEYAKLVPEMDLDLKGPKLSGQAQQIVKDKTGVEDPYQEFKQRHMELAQELYPEVKSIVAKAEDPLFDALIISATGNAIDAGISLDVDVAHQVKMAVENGFVKSDLALLESKLQKEDEVLIIGDNSGEAIFDKLLIEELQEYDLDVIYAYRDLPVLNDVTSKEIEEIGIDKLADRVLSSGAQTPGTILAETTAEFREVYDRAGVVISKGQGNFEGLSDAEREIFFLLKAKCDLVANMLEVDTGDLVFELR